MFNKKPISSTVLKMGTSETGNQYGGAGYKSTFDASKLAGEKLEKYKVREGQNVIDIIPYNAGPNHPLVKTGQAAEGDTMYSLDYFVHKSIGPAKQDFVCLKQFGLNCPCCNEASRYYSIGTEDSKKMGNVLRSKRRCVYIVHDLIDNKFYYFDTAWFSFEKNVNTRAQVTIDEATGAPVNPFDWQSGKSIVFLGAKDKYDGKEFIKIQEASFDFRKREPLSDAVLEHSVDLSAGLLMDTEEDMDKAISGKPVINNSQPAVQKNPIQQTSLQEPSPVDTSVNVLAEQAMSASAQAAPVQTTPAGNTCPCGYNWGEADKYPECATCDVWDKCIEG